MASVNTFNGVFPRPPAGKRPDYLPKRRPGTRYRRPNSLPPIECTTEPESRVSERARSSSEHKESRESKKEDSNDDDHSNVYGNGVGKATSTTSACLSSKLTQRSVSVQVPDEDMNTDELVPHPKRVEVMIIDPVISELYAAKSKESGFTTTTEIALECNDCEVGSFNTSSGLKTHMEGDGDPPTPHASKPMDWDNVSVSAIVELEMMKEDLEEGIIENLEKFGRLLNLETRHNGKDHSAMEHEVAALVSVIKEELDASDDDEDDDYRRMSDLDEDYDYWKINSGVLIWNPPLRADEKSGVMPRKKISQCPTLESIKEEDDGEGDVDDGSEENSEDEMEDAEQVESEHQLKGHAATGMVEKYTVPSLCTSQSVGTAIDALQWPCDKNYMQGSSNKMASVMVTSTESFSSSSGKTIESGAQSEPEILATSSLEPATTLQECATNQTVNSPDSQFSSSADSATSSRSTVTVLVPAESNTCSISVILTSPSDENLAVTAEPSEKTEIHSAPTLSSTSVRPCTADENDQKVVSAPTLTSSVMQPKQLSSTCESRKIPRENEEIDDNNNDDDTHGKVACCSPKSVVSNDEDVVVNQISTKKVRCSDLQFSSTDDSATSTGSTVTVLVPAESNTCNISVILTSPSDENLGVTAESSEKTEIHSAPTLNSTPTGSCSADPTQVISAPTLISSPVQPKQVNTCEHRSAKVAKSNEEVNPARGLVPSSVTASATIDGGNTTAANTNRLDNYDNDEMVHYSRSGEAVCILPVTSNRELRPMNEKPTTQVAGENGTGKSPSRKYILKKANNSPSAFRRCDLKGYNDQRSKAERLEPFRAASKPDTPLEECKIVLRHIPNLDRSKINFLRRSSARTNVIPEEVATLNAKVKKGYPRGKECRPSCDGNIVRKDSCKSPSKAVSSLRDTCAHTCDEKTRSSNSASEDTCKCEAKSVGKNKRRRNHRSKVTAVGRTCANSKSANVAATQSRTAKLCAPNDKVTATPSRKQEKSGHQLVSGTYDSVDDSCLSKSSPGFLPKIPSYNYHKKASLSILSVANGFSVNQVSSEEFETLPPIVSTGQITEEISPSKLPAIKYATTRGSSDANTASHSAKYRQAALKARRSIGGSALPSKVSKFSNSVPSLGRLNEIAVCLEQNRAETLGMPSGHAKPNSIEAAGRLPHDSVQTFGDEMVLAQDSQQKKKSIAVHKLRNRANSDKNHDKLPPLTQPETLSLPKIPLTSDGQRLDATPWIRANRDTILRQASQKNVADRLRKTGSSMSDKGFDKLPQIHPKHKNQSLPMMLHRPPWY